MSTAEKKDLPAKGWEWKSFLRIASVNSKHATAKTAKRLQRQPDLRNEGSPQKNHRIACLNRFEQEPEGIFQHKNREKKAKPDGGF